MYKLEIATDRERLHNQINALQEFWPDLHIIATSSFFAIIGCSLPAMLNDVERELLEQFVNDGVIYRFRCKRQKS